ncbi:MAG: RluA family pseudouridine synthase [Dorea sp.]
MKNNLNILFEDSHIIVCEKPHGTATQSRQIGVPDMVSILKNHIRQNTDTPNPYLAVIHRLDQPVRGLLVFAKTPFAAKELNRQLTGGGFGKYYRALVSQQPECKEATLANYLVKDAKTNSSRVCEANVTDAKFARLSYHVVSAGKTLFEKHSPQETELDIALDTGRHHQIRVQLANIDCPICGDTKYNPVSDDSRRYICLCAYRLEFTHPKIKKTMTFSLL